MGLYSSSEHCYFPVVLPGASLTARLPLEPATADAAPASQPPRSVSELFPAERLRGRGRNQHDSSRAHAIKLRILLILLVVFYINIYILLNTSVAVLRKMSPPPYTHTPPLSLPGADPWMDGSAGGAGVQRGVS